MNRDRWLMVATVLLGSASGFAKEVDFQHACYHGKGRAAGIACERLAEEIGRGNVQGTKADFRKALDRACTLGNQIGCMWRMSYVEGPVHVRAISEDAQAFVLQSAKESRVGALAAAAPAELRACVGGSAEKCQSLGRAFNNIGAWPEAILLLGRACELGDQCACSNLRGARSRDGNMDISACDP
jgi:hypothetical protein